MKKLFFALIFISSLAQAQYKIVGTLQPAEKYEYALLYKIVGARQEFVKNTTIKNGSFYFDLAKDAEPGAYRVTYDANNAGFVDFYYNKEDVVFSFNPKEPETTMTFSKSEENKLYNQFINAVSYVQYNVDSLQVAYLKVPLESTEERYKKAIENIKNVQETFTKNAAGMLVYDFIKATDRYNPETIAKTPNEYLTGVQKHFFDNIDFENKTLYNSPFLVDRISDYVFYMNYSDDVLTQIDLHKKASSFVIDRIKNPVFKKDVIEFLIAQFATTKDVVLVDYLFENHFDKLPQESKNIEFKEKTLSDLRAEIGRIAPDFSWKENGKTMKLSELNDGKNYVLVFWSTTCPHCLREVPQLYNFLKDKSNTKVVAFAMEENDYQWKKLTPNFKGWHHAFGLNKWENKTARLYNIYSTPSYFILNADKEIIAKPDTIEDVKMFFD